MVFNYNAILKTNGAIMQLLKNIDNKIAELGINEQKMLGYFDGEYILQVFEACKNSWFYVLIYNSNDELIGVFTIIMDRLNIMTKILMAKRIKIVENLMEKFIKFRKAEFNG